MTQKSQEGAGVILKRRPSITPTQDKIHVGFAEIAIEELGYTDDDTDFYGLSEAGCVDGGYKMVELVEQHYISREDHDRRVTELLEANNRMLDRARTLKGALYSLYRAFLSRHGCYPIDRTSEERIIWNEAMGKAKKLLGGMVP